MRKTMVIRLRFTLRPVGGTSLLSKNCSRPARRHLSWTSKERPHFTWPLKIGTRRLYWGPWQQGQSQQLARRGWVHAAGPRKKSSQQGAYSKPTTRSAESSSEDSVLSRLTFGLLLPGIMALLRKRMGDMSAQRGLSAHALVGPPAASEAV